jgi:hypothetical protein
LGGFAWKRVFRGPAVAPVIMPCHSGHGFRLVVVGSAVTFNGEKENLGGPRKVV